MSKKTDGRNTGILGRILVGNRLASARSEHKPTGVRIQPILKAEVSENDNDMLDAFLRIPRASIPLEILQNIDPEKSQEIREYLELVQDDVRAFARFMSQHYNLAVQKTEPLASSLLAGKIFSLREKVEAFKKQHSNDKGEIQTLLPAQENDLHKLEEEIGFHEDRLEDSIAFEAPQKELREKLFRGLRRIFRKDLLKFALDADFVAQSEHLEAMDVLKNKGKDKKESFEIIASILANDSKSERLALCESHGLRLNELSEAFELAYAVSTMPHLRREGDAPNAATPYVIAGVKVLHEILNSKPQYLEALNSALNHFQADEEAFVKKQPLTNGRRIRPRKLDLDFVMNEFVTTVLFDESCVHNDSWLAKFKLQGLVQEFFSDSRAAQTQTYVDSYLREQAKFRNNLDPQLYEIAQAYVDKIKMEVRSGKLIVAENDSNFAQLATDQKPDTNVSVSSVAHLSSEPGVTTPSPAPKRS